MPREESTPNTDRMKRRGLDLKKFIAFMIALSLITIGTGAAFAVAAAGTDIKLANPPESLGVDLMDALLQRQSIRSGFTGRELSQRDLATILWAANGVNRKNGQRTAPTALGKYFIDLYVAANAGVYQYDPDGNLLRRVSAHNIKGRIGTQSDIGTASHVLILVAKLRMLPPAMDRTAKLSMANGTAGTIAENVYLIAAALKLGTRLVASLNENNIRTELQLDPDDVPLYIMPLGYVK